MRDADAERYREEPSMVHLDPDPILIIQSDSASSSNSSECLIYEYLCVFVVCLCVVSKKIA